MTIQQLLDTCRNHFGNVDVVYLHPTLYVFCIATQFEGSDDDARKNYFLKTTSIDERDLDRLTAAATMSLYFVTKEERVSSFSFIESKVSSQHWLPLLDRYSRNQLPPAVKGPTRAVHFYGYKGGQARTTVLAMLAKSLANDGYRVLLVDADIEAPSLDFMFEIGAADLDSTLMGLSGWSDNISPIAAYASPSSRGSIDIIPCRPRGEEYDMDFAAFGLRVALDVSTLHNAVHRLKAFVQSDGESGRYDVVVFDHRTGIAPSVLPIIHAWGGPTIVNVRPDGLSTHAIGAFASLFAQNPENPGAYVCFSLDPDDSKDKIFNRANEQISSLLEQLSIGLARGAEDAEPLPADALYRYWVNWYHDRAFSNKVSPEFDRMSSDNQASIRQLREVLSLSTAFKQRTVQKVPYVTRSPSGATDPGWFIETPDIARLFSVSSPTNYIVGRKGTGKTRLHREMVARGLAEPLFASADYEGGGLKSQSASYSRLLDACEGDFRRFWWSLLHISLMTPDTKDDTRFDAALSAWCERPLEERKTSSTPFSVATTVAKGTQERIFVIDGIETAVPAARLHGFIEELLIFMLALQTDTKFKPIQVRLFLRTDLLSTASQNIEQQTSQRLVELRWDRDSIFNYVLARIERIEWFNQNFKEACGRINELLDVLQAGKVSAKQYEELLLEIFPNKLRRNNIQTLTFLETYFSDASGPVDYGSSFYPRLFEAFLMEIAAAAAMLQEKGQSALEGGRISHTIVLDAHAKASTQFMNEVKQELYVLLDLGTNDMDNRRMVDALVAAFDGQGTPFDQDEVVDSLEPRILGATRPKLRAALQLMTDVGIFEKHPKYPGQLRAGRLYKSALRMKYVR